MSKGLATNLAVGTGNVNASYLSANLSLPITVLLQAAWQSINPLTSALVSDFPGRDYASTATFRSNTLSRYANASFDTRVYLDSTLLYNGYDTLANDRTIGDAAMQLIIPSSTSQTDIVYHVRRALSKRQANDLIPGINFSNNPSFGNSTHSVICGLAFDSSLYQLPTSTTGSTNSGIMLMLDFVNGLPVYKLIASIYNTSGTLLTTTSPNVTATTLGDECYNGEMADYFIRVYLSSANTLAIEAYMADAQSAPKQIAICSITMISGNAPMPKYGMNNIVEPWFITPAISSLAFHQVISNSVYPNSALDFATPISASGIGIGEHGYSIVRRTINLEQYADDTAFQADVFTGTPIHGRFPNYFGTPAPYLITATDATHDNKKFFRMGHPFNSTTHSTGLHDDATYSAATEWWWKENIVFSPGWSEYGAGIPVATLAQNVVASGSPQTVNINAAYASNGNSGLIGYGTANSEQVNFTVSGATITGVFTKNHSTGDEVSQAAGPGYKLSQVGLSYNGDSSNDLRMELVGNVIESYNVSNNGYLDAAYPAFCDAGTSGFETAMDATGLYRGTNMTSGSPVDMVTTPLGNAQGASGYSGTRSGQGIKLEFRGRAKSWFDADYGRVRTRLEHYIGLPGFAPYRYQMIECFAKSSVITTALTGMHYGENFNERTMAAQNLDRWDCECCDPNVPSVGPDPYNVAIELSLAYPAAATCGSATSPTTTTLTYPVTAPATGSTVLLVMAEVFNGTVWIPVGTTGTAWTVGAGGIQNIVVTGLTTGTNYTGKIRFRLVSNYGMGPAVVCTNGTTI